VEKLPDK